MQQRRELDNSQLLQGLQGFILFDQLTCAAAVVVMLVVYGSLHPSRYLLVLAAVVGAATVVMGRGAVAARRGQLDVAVAWVAVANWSVAIVATTIATFCLPVTVVAAILPVALAVPYVSRVQLRLICAASLTAASVTVLVGTVQDVSGFSAGLPAWIRTTVVVVFVPFILGLVVLISTHNHVRLARSLDTTLAANDRLRDSERELRRSRARLVAAAERERRRIGRDLHDGTQQRLIALGLGLAQARAVAARRPADADQLLARLDADVRAAMAELRHLAHGLHPPHLADLGLAVALTDAAERLGRPCRVAIGALGRYPPEVEATVYFCCTEALQNAVKHAGERATLSLRVDVTDTGGILFEVVDDGTGFDPLAAPTGRGLTNIADRVGAVGGEMLLDTAIGRGTTLRATLPPPEQRANPQDRFGGSVMPARHVCGRSGE